MVLKYLEGFKMCYWRRMEKYSWTDRVRNEEVWLRVIRRGISYVQQREGKLFGHILQRNCLQNTLLKERHREGYK
jgi:hypothetical protein